MTIEGNVDGLSQVAFLIQLYFLLITKNIIFNFEGMVQYF